MSTQHWTFDEKTGEPQCACEGFHCPYANEGEKRCPAWRCDCFIETHPETPFALHPEDFKVVAPSDHAVNGGVD